MKKTTKKIPCDFWIYDVFTKAEIYNFMDFKTKSESLSLEYRWMKTDTGIISSERATKFPNFRRLSNKKVKKKTE
jgi:hypothetical protein